MKGTSAHILILEDEPSWQGIYAEVTSQMGYTCQIASNASDALFRLIRGFYHLVIVDLSLVRNDPRNLDGLKVLRWIREMNEGTQGLVSTGYAFPKSIRDAFKEGGAFDVIEKGQDDREDIERAISKGVAIAKRQMSASFSPINLFKDLNTILLRESLGILTFQFEQLVDNLLYFANELLEDAPNTTKQSKDFSRQGVIPLPGVSHLLRHRSPIRVLSNRQDAIVVLQYWDRIFERCMVLRISRQEQIKREYEFFLDHAKEAYTLGFTQISRPFYMESFGGIIYVADETDNLFSEFEHPWVHLLSSLELA